ncbi:CCA tRNA nucleotidyltransferase [Staphylococcus agnetis]|uniref:CCA tRNA nucleotidyltransferase n=1 Tax=Staphylococcus agnetis TaxID=985762 RepID=UPI000CD21073|nr:CCA tRNA nucleotidyltransferase [Staphylococcus agnetis]NJH68500.1 CCA tRNA nucleotidyltransferase [Staphylococcus agnetis]PNY85437.1 CCA tRNA nucleotidyltransferase [Staphylococcus agnetis]PTH68565.1 CCA tRNA nucleotidyltransferase [Staphylococcus agnetis]
MTKTAFYDAIPVMEHISKHGFKAYFVGGAVRDYYLQRDIHDIDIATSATPDEIEAIFEHTIPVGKEHGTINVVFEGDNYEITTFRTEGDYDDHRRPNDVQFVRSLYEDVARRDFTINAMAMDTSFKLYDYFEGRHDLTAGLIRTVGDPNLRFAEDALRIIRGLRFQSQLNFEIDPNTFEAMRNAACDIAYLSIERIIAELDKLLKGSGIEKAFSAIQSINLLAHVPYFNQYQWQTLSLSEPLTLVQFLALLYLLEGKKAHIKTLKLSNQTLKEADVLYSAVSELQSIQSKRDLQIWLYDYGITLAQTILDLRPLFQNHGIMLPSPLFFNATSVHSLYEQLPIRSRKEIPIDGKVLMEVLQQPSGPWLKQALRKIECAVITQETLNTQSDIIEWVKSNVEV